MFYGLLIYTILNFATFKVMPGGQQQPAFDPFLGTAPEMAAMVSFLTTL